MILPVCFWPSPLDLFGEGVQWLVGCEDWDLSRVQNLNCCFDDVHGVTNHSHRLGLVVEERQQ